MNFCTASGRLKKTLFLSLVQRLSLDVCYRCKQPIVNPEDLSIDHIEDWQDNDPKLFWELSNITFSHIKCNRPSRRKGGLHRRKKSPDGYSWCSSCSESKPKNDFANKSSRWNGKHQNCKKCDKERKDKWRRGGEAEPATLEK